MDPTDARRVVRAIAIREGADPDAVLARARGSHCTVLARRIAVLELRMTGTSFRLIGAALSRDPAGIFRIVRRALARSTPDLPS